MFINFIALVTLAVLGAVAPVPEVNALSLESHNFVRNGAGHAHAARHHALNRRQAATSRPRRCKARPTGSSLSASSSAGSTPSTSKAQAAPTTSKAAAAPSTSKAAAAPAPTSSKPVEAKPSSTTKAVTPAPTQGSGSGYNSKKACIAYVGNVNVAKFASGSHNVGCVINWSSWKPNFMSQLNGAYFVPMFHGPGQATDLQRNVVAGFSNFVLGFNEPDQGGQANISPARAVQLWWQYLEPLKSQGYTLVSPACTNAPYGLQWQKEFINSCQGCHVDAIATHFYGTDAEALVAHLNQYHDTFGRNLWLTEFACQDFSGRNAQCSADKIWAFMDRTVGFMESVPWVSHYAWFGALQNENLGGVSPLNRLINDDSSPTALGRKYLGI